MSFKLLRAETDQAALAFITDRLGSLDAERPKLLLLSGGSAVRLEAQLTAHLDRSYSLGLVDERYGAPGHGDSNARALAEAGVSDLHLVLNGSSLAEDAANYEKWLAGLGPETVRIVILGMGPDGHTAGLLPHAPIIGSRHLVDSYRADDYERISVTPAFLERIDLAFVYAMGESKHAQIDRLVEDIDLASQPIQIVKRMSEVYFINDYKGEVI